MFARRQCRRLFNPNYVVFETEIRVDVFLVLEMASDDARAIRERQHTAIRAELVRQLPKQPPPQVLEVLHVRLAHFPQQQTLQARHTLAIIRAHLSEKPMRLATATSATIADGCRAIGFV